MGSPIDAMRNALLSNDLGAAKTAFLLLTGEDLALPLSKEETHSVPVSRPKKRRQPNKPSTKPKKKPNVKPGPKPKVRPIRKKPSSQLPIAKTNISELYDDDDGDEETVRTKPDSERVAARRVPFKAPTGPNKFKASQYANDPEVLAAGEFDKLAVHNVRPIARERAVAKKVKVTCRVCKRSEKVFASYIMNEKKNWLCNNCCGGR